MLESLLGSHGHDHNRKQEENKNDKLNETNLNSISMITKTSNENKKNKFKKAKQVTKQLKGNLNKYKFKKNKIDLRAKIKSCTSKWLGCFFWGYFTQIS